MNRRNYQRELEAVIKENQSKSRVPRLFLHSCCAPCSSYVLEYLSDYFEITVFYYNPNICPEEEYEKRVAEQKHLIQELTVRHPIHLVVGNYEPERFYALSKGLETVPEGGERCFSCYELRQREAAIAAAQGGYDYFTTTLSVSPHKNAQKLNEIGLRLQEEFAAEFREEYKEKDHCSCQKACRYHGNCKECVAIHRAHQETTSSGLAQ